MSQFHSLLVLPTLLSLFFITGCSSTPPISSRADTASISDVKLGKKAMVLMTNSGQSCEKSTFEFQNIASEEIVEMKIVQQGRSYGYSIGQPAIVTIQPGTYKVISGNCASHPYQTLYYSDIEKWLKPFSVRGGDVRFLGNIQVSAAKGEGRQGLANAAVGRLLNMGLSTNKPTDYVVLKVANVPASAKSVLRINHPNLVEDFKSNPIEAQIDANAFRKIVTDAYSPDENGKAPLKSDAHKVVRAYIDSFDLNK